MHADRVLEFGVALATSIAADCAAHGGPPQDAGWTSARRSTVPMEPYR